MKLPSRFFLALLIALALSVAPAAKIQAQQQDSQSQNWTSWRGPLGSGEAPKANPPLKWSETENLRFKTPLPGLGHSSPVVWQDKIFLTTAVPVGKEFDPIPDNAPGSHDNLPVKSKHEFVVICVNRKSGKIEWKKTVNSAIPHHGAHHTASLASGSPVVDANHVYAHFGSYGLFCLDFAGNVVWKRDFDKMQSKHAHGEGSSPALHGDTIVVNWDHEEQSYILALDKNTGDEKWKVNRDEVTSWSSPVIAEHEKTFQVIVPGTNRTRAYDLKDGSVIWEAGGLSGNVVASPIAQEGMVYVGSSYEKKAMFGIKLAGAKGDISGTANIVWSVANRTPYVPSPLLYDGQLYFLRHYQGIMSRLTAKTGAQTEPPIRVVGMRDIYASPVAADGRIYITSIEGVTAIYSATEWPRLLGISKIDDNVSASLVLVNNELIVRGHKFLYSFERPVAE